MSSGKSNRGPYLSKKEQITAKLGHNPGEEAAAAAEAAIFPMEEQKTVRAEDQ